MPHEATATAPNESWGTQDLNYRAGLAGLHLIQSQLYLPRHSGNLLLLQLSFLAAIQAQACHAEFDSTNIETVSFANFFLELRAQRTDKLHDFTAVKAQKMLMLSRRFHLIVMMLLSEVMLFYQAQFFEKLQISVNCG